MHVCRGRNRVRGTTDMLSGVDGAARGQGIGPAPIVLEVVELARDFRHEAEEAWVLGIHEAEVIQHVAEVPRLVRRMRRAEGT